MFKSCYDYFGKDNPMVWLWIYKKCESTRKFTERKKETSVQNFLRHTGHLKNVLPNVNMTSPNYK